MADTFEVEVFSGSTPWTGSAIVTLAEDEGRSFRRAMNDVGSYSVVVPNVSDDADEIITYRWFKFRVNGTVEFSGRIGPWGADVIAQNEEAGENYTLTGPGAIDTLSDATVYPHASTGRLARDSRFFNFASPDYPDEGDWTSAIELFRQDDAGSSLYGIDIPQNWPDGTAYWMWGVDIDLMSSPPMPIGDCYFRATVNLTDAADIAFFITADDGYELWCDGVMLASQREAFIYQQTYRIDQFLDAGDHVIAIKGTNIIRPVATTNAAAVLFAMYTTTNGGELAVLQLHSDSTWICSAYPATPPGFTAGEIMEILVADAQARGALLVWNLDFDGDLDSNSDAWTQEIDTSFRFDQTVLDALKQLAESLVDFTADYDAIHLVMTNKGGLNAAPGVVLEDGVNFFDLSPAGTPGRVTDLLAQDSEGVLTELSSGVASISDPANPRIEQFLSAGSAGSATAVTTMADGIFADNADPKITVRGTVEPVTGDTPLANFDEGDVITMPLRDGTPAAHKVTAITVTGWPPAQDGSVGGQVMYMVEAEVAA